MPDPQPFLLGRVTLTVELEPDGTRSMGMNININADDGDYQPTKIYDIHAMLGFAQANLADPEWRDLAYPEDGDD